MKKFSWILALIAALAMVFIGCGGGQNEPGEPDPVESLVLVDNFQYGHGYQGVMSVLDFTGRIGLGDEYTLTIKFTVNRDLEEPLYVGLVDPSSTANYWKPLTWAGDPAKPSLIKGEGDLIKKDEVIEFTVDWTTIAASTGNSAGQNSIVFMTDGHCPACGATIADCSTYPKEHGASSLGTGTKGPVTITFEEFKLNKKAVEGEPCCTDCDEECEDCITKECTGECGDECCIVEKFAGTKATVKVGMASQDITVTGVGTGTVVKYLDNNSGYMVVNSGAYGVSYAKFKVDLGTGKKPSFYKEIKLTYQGVGGDVGWKPVYILASDDAEDFTGSINATYDSLTVGQVSYSNSGLNPQEFTFDIARAKKIEGQEVWFVVYLHAKADDSPADPSPTSFIVSNIQFIEACCGAECDGTCECECDCQAEVVIPDDYSIDLEALATANSSKLDWDTDTTKGGAAGIVNKNAFTGGTSSVCGVPLVLPESFNIAGYSLLTVRAVILDTDGAATAATSGTFKFIQDGSNEWSAEVHAVYNLGSNWSGSNNPINNSIAGVTTFPETVGINFGLTDAGFTAGGRYIKITEILFHNPKD